MALRRSIQQAAVSSLSTWLASQFPDCAVYDRWPEANVSLTKAITIIRAGARVDDYIDPVVLRQINSETNPTQSLYTWRLAYCSQPVQLDVWTTSDVVRDDIMARLDDALHSGFTALGDFSQDPVSNDVFLNFREEDGWFGAVNFRFDSPDLIETPDNVQQTEYRATYKGFAFFELSVDAPSPRLAQINLQLKISQQLPPPTDLTPDLTIITVID